MIKICYDLIVYFIRIDEEYTFNNRYVKLTYKYDITTERFISNISKQNNVVECSKKVIIRKIRCLRTTTNLFVNL